MHLPSCTEVLKPWIDFSHVPPGMLQLASERGTRVHEACAAHALGIWMPYPDGDVRGYIFSFHRWFDSQVAEVLLVEERLADDRLGYHGQIDLVVRLKSGEVVIVDLKTPLAKSKAWRLQMAGYLNLYPTATKAGSLRLHPAGKVPKMDWYDGSAAADLAVFLSCLNVHRHFNS